MMTPSELKKMTRAELIKLARKNGIKVNTKMLKDELVRALSRGLKGGASSGGGAKPKKASPGAKAGSVKPGAKAKRKTGAKAGKKAGAAAGSKPAASKAGAKRKTGAKAAGKAKRRAAGKKAGSGRPTSIADERTIRQRAEAGKYHLTTAPMKLPPVDSMEIPSGYGADRVTVMVRDPWWLFAYWEVTGDTWRRLEEAFGSDWEKCRFVLRVYDRTGRSGGYFDVDTGYGSRSWYVNVSPGRAYQTSIGIVGPDGRFEEIAVSNTMETPRDTVSDVVDERWVVPDEVFRKIFAASGGYAAVSGPGSEEVGGRVEQRLLGEMGSGAVSSFGSAGIPEEARKRGFWLWVATELVLYGATEPDARVTIKGEEIELRGDGTFSARFALPDGKIEIPVEAVSGDGAEERGIDTGVSKKSRDRRSVKR